MAGPYDYTINIPQPPAQNFLQSLMGIRQLQQMEEQGAIQQQQAAIAQQNAAFQQQLQPLEKQRLEATIAAARANTAQSGAATKLSTRQLTEFDRKSKLLSDFQTKGLELAKDPSSWTQDKLNSYAMEAAILDPTTAQELKAFTKQNPKSASFLNDTAAYIALAANNQRPDLILPRLERDIKTTEALLEKNPNDQALMTQLDFLNQNKATAEKDPVAAGLEALTLVGRTDDKFFDNILKAIKQPVEIEEIQAKTKAEKVKTKIEEAKLTLGGKEMSDKQQDDINKLTYASSELRNTTSAFDEQLNLILNFAEQNPKEFKTGALASIENWASGKQGVAQQAKNLRSNFQRFATEDWIKRAEPLKGGLNKEEGERLERGVPDIMTATPSELLNFGRLVSKINLLEADQKELNAAWQQNARSLQAKAPAEFEAAGITVRAGERWSEAQTRLRDSYKKKNEKQLQEDVLRLKRIQDAGKSGQSPVPNMYNLGGAPQQQQPTYVPPSGVIIKSRK